MKQIFSPHRICPIGAHVDHQGGLTLGRTLALGTTLEYEPLDLPEIHLASAQFGETRFLLGEAIEKTDWARYARAAALVLGERLKRGMRARVDGPSKPLLPVDGRPMLDYVLRAVKQAGVERVCLVTNHLEEQIFEYVGSGACWGVEVCFAHQAALRGNGDALLSVPPDWRRDEPLLVAATDYALDEHALLELVQAQESRRAAIVMSLKECPPKNLRRVRRFRLAPMGACGASSRNPGPKKSSVPMLLPFCSSCRPKFGTTWPARRPRRAEKLKCRPP